MNHTEHFMIDWREICEQNPESGQNDLAPVRGIFWGFILSLPVWTLIGWLVWRWTR